MVCICIPTLFDKENYMVRVLFTIVATIAVGYLLLEGFILSLLKNDDERK